MSEFTQSEQPAIELFQKLGYEYFDAKKEMYITLKKGLLQKLLIGKVSVNV